MRERLKIILFVALLGFLGGVIADFTAEYVVPVLIELFPKSSVLGGYCRG